MGRYWMKKINKKQIELIKLIDEAYLFIRNKKKIVLWGNYELQVQGL